MRFDTDNAAFDEQGAQAVAQALRAVADRIESGEATGLFQNVYDENGNNIGTWKLVLRPVPFTCCQCGQHITDGKPCGCGAR